MGPKKAPNSPSKQAYPEMKLSPLREHKQRADLAISTHQ